MSTYFAINMNDFHANQSGPGTTVQIMFISSESKAGADRHMEIHHPGIAWAVITKASVDANIIYGKKEELSC